MAGERVKIVVRERETRGSRDTRRLRKQGLVPGVLYGRGEPTAFTVGERDLRSALTTDAGLHAILDVQIDGTGKTHASVVKDYQQDVIRGGITHIDLHEVRLDQPIHATVALHLVGESAGSKEGGVLAQAVTELNVEALPLEIPAAIEVDVTELHIGDSLRVADVTAPDGVTLLDDPETPIASVTLPTRVEEPEEAAEEGEEGEVAEGEEPAEGEASGESGAEASGEQQTVEG